MTHCALVVKVFSNKQFLNKSFKVLGFWRGYALLEIGNQWPDLWFRKEQLKFNFEIKE